MMIHSVSFPSVGAILALALLLPAGACDWFSEETPPADAKPLSEIIKALEDQGYKTITEVEFEDGKWKIELHQTGGKEVWLKVDPMTGTLAP
jgi:hypothetical protein